MTTKVKNGKRLKDKEDESITIEEVIEEVKVSKAKKVKKASKKSSKISKKRSVKKVVDETLELPLMKYKIVIENLFNILYDFSNENNINISIESSFPEDIELLLTPQQIFKILKKTPEELGPDVTSQLLTCLREYEEQSIIFPPEEVEKVDNSHMTKQDFTEKRLKGLFFLYNEDRYQYYDLKIAPSTIKKAGMGVYAAEEIPIDAIGQYKGIPRASEETNGYYSWMVKAYNVEGYPIEGCGCDHADKCDEENRVDNYLFAIDATDQKRSNWTRYVNCGMKNKQNNMEQDQIYDKVYYLTTRKIKKGEELFIDYGEEYRVYNFGMKAENY